MLSYEVAVQGPESRAAILHAVRRAASAADFNRITGLFAYATERGVDLLTDVLDEAIPGWHNAEKRWFVSVDFGRTEPKALGALRSLGHSEVFVPYARRVMARRFKPVVCFHPKTLILQTGRSGDRGPIGIIAGSANLTFSGLVFGHEHTISLVSRQRTAAEQRWASGLLLDFERSIDSLLPDATRVTRAFIGEYRALRPRRVKSEDDNPRVVRLAGEPTDLRISHTAELAAASKLWVEVEYVVRNLGPGVPGNQVDLQRGTRAFFGLPARQVPRNTPLGEVVIRYRNHVVPCHMRFGNNSMDKLNLPLPGVDGPPHYEHETLLFSRSPDDSFELEVGTPAQVRQWKAASRAQQTLYAMQSGREFGVFD